MRRQPSPAEISTMLGERAEDLCRQLLPAGKRDGHKWRVGDVEGNPGQSMIVHLNGDRAGVWHDFAPRVGGDALDLVKAVLNLDTLSAIQWAKNWLGLRDDDNQGRTSRRRGTPGQLANRQANRAEPESPPNLDRARQIWKATQPAIGSLVEAYLRSRGITLPIPTSIRFHPGLKHQPTGLMFPAMVAAVARADGGLTAVHRTYLLPDGCGKARVSSPKMALGPLHNGAVRLASAGNALGLAEGIETAMSAMEIFDIPVWAALGSRLDRVTVPEGVIEVQVFGDNGQAGQEAAEKAADAFTKAGRRVCLRFPPDHLPDWNDALQAEEQREGA